MRKLNRHLIILLLLAGVLLCICYGSERRRGVPKFDRIVVVIEENRAYSNIIGDLADAPFINATLVPRTAVMTNFHAEAHPSEPNYFALYAGSTFGVSNDGNYNEPDPSLYTILGDSVPSLTFAGYVESSGTNARDGTTLAVRKHNPWESFPEGKRAEKDFSSFPDDFTQLPVVCWVIPNLNNDMHDGTIAVGDAWLKNHISAYATWCQTHNSLLIITWDEDDSKNLVPNRIPTLVMGQHVKPGTYSENVNHYNLLFDHPSVSGPKGTTQSSNCSANHQYIQHYGAVTYGMPK